MDCNCSCVHSDLSLMDEVLDTYADTKGSLITILALRRFTPSSVCSRSVNI